VFDLIVRRPELMCRQTRGWQGPFREPGTVSDRQMVRSEMLRTLLCAVGDGDALAIVERRAKRRLQIGKWNQSSRPALQVKCVM
jgi:hypothetical protein